MRTTVTLEEDVAIVLDRIRRERDLTFKEALNRVLRLGLEQLERPARREEPFHTPAADTGRVLIPNVDDIAEILELVDQDTRGT